MSSLSKYLQLLLGLGYVDDLIMLFEYCSLVTSVGIYEILIRASMTSLILFHMHETCSRQMFCTKKPNLIFVAEDAEPAKCH